MVILTVEHLVPFTLIYSVVSNTAMYYLWCIATMHDKYLFIW